MDQCRVMESKKKPLWMTLKNSDPAGPNIVLMLKVSLTVHFVTLLFSLNSAGLGWRRLAARCTNTSIATGDGRFVAPRRLGNANDVVRLHIHGVRKGSIAGYYYFCRVLFCNNHVYIGCPQRHDTWARLA